MLPSLHARLVAEERFELGPPATDEQLAAVETLHLGFPATSLRRRGPGSESRRREL